MTCTHRSLIRIAATWLVALLISFAPPLIEQAYADRALATQHYQSGRELFSAGDYQGAIREFETANRLAPSPVLDFNIGLARERLGQLEQAVQHYRAYIAAMPNANNRAAVDAKIQTLEKELAEKRSAAATAATTDPGIGGRRPEPLTGSATDANNPTVETSSATEGNNAFGAVVNSTANPATGAETVASDSAASSVDAKKAHDLRRVAQVDIAKIRDERALSMSAPRPEPIPQTAQPTGHADFGKKKKVKPAYKKWWFWAIVGVSAYILIDLATGEDGNTRTVPVGPLSGGPVLIRF